MLGTQLVVVSDAHLAASPAATDEAFLDFLDQVPSLGDCLLINGDLFDFWFSYRRVIPRRGFAVTAALTVLARKLPILMTGGNHDRWGDSFWEREAGIRYHADRISFGAAGRSVTALHGDGLTEVQQTSAVMHRITRHPLTSWLYRIIHPDLGIWLVDRISRHLADSTRDPAVLDRAQQRQEAWAQDHLERHPEVGVLVMSHTHRPAAIEMFPGRWYVNPGAWIDGLRYAVVSQSGATLHQYGRTRPADTSATQGDQGQRIGTDA